ncbi:MAG: DUF4255 domain-containing protein [bacterium]|nr:DUF4255 domain-containing protein [bacterium]
MSSYAVVAAVSEALRRILWEEFEKDGVIQPIVGSELAIVFRNPTETARDSANRLSLWLHHITENEFLKNQPMERGPTYDTQRFPPLALNFSYLVTPFAPSGEADHLLLGKTMQILYDNAVVLLRDETSDVGEELRIIFNRLSLEELTRIWEALREPYRLSLCYQVRVTRIDSQRLTRQARVIDRLALLRTSLGEEKR